MQVILTKILNRTGEKYRLRLDYSLSGKRYRQALGIDIYANPTNRQQKDYNAGRLELAEAIRRNKEEDLIRLKAGIPGTRYEESFIQYCEDWIKSYPLEDKRRYRYTVNYLRDFIGHSRSSDIRGGELTINFCEMFAKYLGNSRHLHSSTPSMYFLRFKKMLRAAFRDRVVLVDPQHIDVKFHKEAIIKKESLTMAEIELLIKTDCEHGSKWPFLFQCVTGLDFSTLGKLEWSYIKEDHIDFERSKTKRKNKVPLTPVAKYILEQVPRGINPRVFQLPTTNGYNKAIKKWIKRAGINKHITSHSARHTIGMILAEQGVDINVIRAIYDHSSIQTTLRYVNSSMRKKQEAMSLLDQIELPGNENGTLPDADS